MKKLEMPKVSIVIPIYNGSKYMKEAIDSALAQTYKNFEIIVINDGSNDDGKTAEIAKSYGNKIRYYEKKNGGVSTALNLAISKMNGEYFSWLSHDDVYYPNKLEKQIEYILDNDYRDKNIILYSDYDLIDKKSRLISRAAKDHEMLTEKPEYALLRGSINGITLLIPKRAFDEYGVFDEKLRCTQDYELWQRMSKGYTFHHMSGIVAKSRQHGEQVSVTNPKVITEGNVLWKDMVVSTSPKVMARLEGSVYAFYKAMAKFLADSPYIEVANFCEEKFSEMEAEMKKQLDGIKVSVIIPFYNRVDLLMKAIDSVISQTHKNVELLLIDDGSTDDVTQLKKEIKKDKRITYIRLNKNGGAANARNVGLDKTTGEYIAFLDSDDLFMEDKIIKQLLQTLLFDANVSHTSYLRKGFGKEEVMHSGVLNGEAIPRIIHSCNIATPTVMINKKFLDSNNYRFNPNLSIGEDVCFWLELLRNQNILGLDEPLTIVNVGTTSAAYNIEKQILGIKTILTFVLNDIEYQKYDYEIAVLCGLYITYVNELQHGDVINASIQCPNCIAMVNSRSWKITKPFRLLSKIIETVRKYGIIVTLKKAIRKIRAKLRG